MSRSSAHLSVLASLPLVLGACAWDNTPAATNPAAQVQARLLVDESSDTAVIRLDSAALGGVDVQAELSVATHPWWPDSITLRKVADHWIVTPVPDGPWQIDATLRDRSGKVRATGTKAFMHASPFTLCGHELTLGEWVGLLGGNLVIVAGVDEGARRGKDVVKEILAAMVLGSVDFDRLSNLHLTFSNGVYRYGTDPERIDTRFAFVAAQAFGTYVAGDTVRENIAEISSFVKNVDVSLTDGVTWDRGSLFGLVRGSVDFDGRTPSFSIDPGRVSLTLATQALITRSRSQDRVVGDSVVITPLPPDSLRFRVSLMPATLRSVQSSLDSGTLSFGIDGTTFTSHVEGVTHLFHHSLVRLYNDSAGAAQFVGSYQVNASAGDFKYYHRGVISSTSEQSTLFACDEALHDTLGIAHHAKDLTHGEFVTASGLVIPYGLVEF